MDIREQQRCASIVKGLHASLRAAARESGDEEAWRQHVSSTRSQELHRYADAMHRLARLWPSDPATCRLIWIRTQCERYFLKGDLYVRREKELRLAEKLGMASVLPSPASREKIRALDVGSCYGPFGDVDFAETLSIDLAPAVPDVLRCDFLDVEIGTKLEMREGTVVSLPERSYDAVFFSLLLEYVPTSRMRIRCCEKAYKLLDDEGILIIITPDSKHVGANAKLYKNWRYVLSLLGFSRIVYEKLPSLHCMTFRKSINPNLPRRWGALHRENYMNDEIEIPQDFRPLQVGDDDDNLRIENDPSTVAEMFQCLPEIDYFR